MAMLAEPRQRKRYNLVPRGKALYEDDSRFGTKMLEKMGWSKGKGLGAKEEGALDFVRVRYKNDAEGFGYEQRDDQWTQHEDGFNGLLKSLNGEEDTVSKCDSKKVVEQNNNSDDDRPRVGFGFQAASATEDGQQKSNKRLKLKEKISGISLEEKSKSSKARVHYKKFTRGKDLSQYSEKDLANIFGKKVEDEQQMAVNDFYQQLSNTFSKPSEKETENNDEEDTNEKSSGVQMISTGVSVSDYFKKKMDDIKNRRNGHNNAENNVEQEISTEVQEEETSKKKKKKKEKKDQELEEESVINKTTVEEKESNTSMFSSGVSVADYFKNKMEEMKKRQKANISTENKIDTDGTTDVQEDIPKKKNKNKKENKDQVETKEVNNIGEEEQVTIKSKKSKKMDTEDVEVTKKQSDISEEKTLKRKRKNEADPDPQEFIQEFDLTQEPEKKKKKKNKTIDAIEEIKVEETAPKVETTPNSADSPLEFVQEIDLTQEPEKKKKKKNKITNAIEEIKVEETAQKVETTPNSADSPLEFVEEIDLTQEPEKKKKKKTKTKDPLKATEVNETARHEETIPNSADSPLELVNGIDLTQEPEKNKSKKTKTKDPLNDTKQDKFKQALNKSTKQKESNQINGSTKKDVKKPKKSKSIDVSSLKIPKQFMNDIQSLTLDEIKTKYELCNLYPLSSFCAEKFRNINLHHFSGSTLPQVDGYAFSQDIKLDVKIIPFDEERITNLWKNTLDKYHQLEKPKKTYKHYIKDVIKARKTKQRRPKLHVKTWKRKNAFQAI